MFYLTNCLDIQAFQIFALKTHAEMNIITQDPCTILKYFLKEGLPGREIAKSKGYMLFIRQQVLTYGTPSYIPSRAS